MFFALSKILTWLINPISWYVVLILSIVFFKYFNRHKIVKILQISIIALFCLVVFSPLSFFLLSLQENKYPTPNLQNKNIVGVVILGGAVNIEISKDRNQINVNESADRLLHMLLLAQKYPSAKIVFSGGSGGLLQQQYKEANQVKRLISKLELDEKRFIFESKSRNTFENATFTKQILLNKNTKITGDWLLVTSANHMPRSMGVFKKIGWNLIPYPVDFKTKKELKFLDWFGSIAGNHYLLKIFLHESVGSFVYWLTDKQ